MGDYYAVVRSGSDDDHLEHLFGFGSKKGSEKKNHKYVARVKDGDGYRYFYSTTAYAAYMAGRATESVGNAAKGAAGAVGNAAKGAGKAISGAAKGAGKAVADTADKVYERAQLETLPEVRSAASKYDKALEEYETSKKNYKKSSGREASANAISTMGKRYTAMKLAESEYKKIRSARSPKALIKLAVDSATGKTKKEKYKADVKSMIVNYERRNNLDDALKKVAPKSHRAYELTKMRNKANRKYTEKAFSTKFNQDWYQEAVAELKGKKPKSKKKVRASGGGGRL